MEKKWIYCQEVLLELYMNNKFEEWINQSEIDLNYYIPIDERRKMRTAWIRCKKEVSNLLKSYQNDILDSRNPEVLIKEIIEKIEKL